MLATLLVQNLVFDFFCSLRPSFKQVSRKMESMEFGLYWRATRQLVCGAFRLHKITAAKPQSHYEVAYFHTVVYKVTKFQQTANASWHCSNEGMYRTPKTTLSYPVTSRLCNSRQYQDRGMSHDQHERHHVLQRPRCQHQSVC